MEQRKLTVMQMISNLDIGGAQEVVRTIVDYMASSNCRPVVCTFKDGPLRQQIEAQGIPVEVLPERRYSILAFPFYVVEMVQIWQALVRLIRKYDVEVVQTHLLRSLDFLVLLLLYTTRLRIVLWTIHNANFELAEHMLNKNKWLLSAKRTAHRTLYRLASSRVSGFVAVSDEVENSMLRVFGPIQDKVTVICNGVDVKRYQRPVNRVAVRRSLGLEDQAKLMSVVATFKEQKGHRYLVEAMTSIVPQHPNAHVLFIGDGDLRADLEQQVKAANLEDHIHFLGSRSDVADLLLASDFFILPSLWEGLPMALLEAMSAGLPIVASEVSGTIQAMIPNETGLLVPPGDSQQLAQAILRLLDNPQEAQTMGRAAKARVEANFSAHKQAEEHLVLYERLLAAA